MYIHIGIYIINIYIYICNQYILITHPKNTKECYNEKVNIGTYFVVVLVVLVVLNVVVVV